MSKTTKVPPKSASDLSLDGSHSFTSHSFTFGPAGQTMRPVDKHVNTTLMCG